MRKEDVVAGPDSKSKVGNGGANRFSATLGSVYHGPEVAAHQERAVTDPDEKLAAAAVTVIGDVLAELASWNDGHEIAAGLDLLLRMNSGRTSDQ
jgi:hypothetical protein